MADDLKKVGLVFKADGTADFAKSLKTINSLTQENYSSFKLAKSQWDSSTTVSYTHLRAHETGRNLVCRLLLEKKKKKVTKILN